MQHSDFRRARGDNGPRPASATAAARITRTWRGRGDLVAEGSRSSQANILAETAPRNDEGAVLEGASRLRELRVVG